MTYQHREDYQREISGRTIGSYFSDKKEEKERMCTVGESTNKDDEYAIDFAPDGEHFQNLKRGTINKMWDFFNFNTEIAVQKSLNPHAKFKLKNLTSGCIIGVK